MPCNDVTEIIEVVIDDEDRFKEYTFNKRSCGQGVGAHNLLIDLVRGRSIDFLLAVDAPEFLAEYPIEHELEEFLNLKHIFAIQAALEVLTGRVSGGPKDPCAAAEIRYDNDTGDTVIVAQIPVELLTEKIRSCGGCKSCGKSKEKVVFY